MFFGITLDLCCSLHSPEEPYYGSAKKAQQHKPNHEKAVNLARRFSVQNEADLLREYFLHQAEPDKKSNVSLYSSSVQTSADIRLPCGFASPHPHPLVN